MIHKTFFIEMHFRTEKERERERKRERERARERERERERERMTTMTTITTNFLIHLFLVATRWHPGDLTAPQKCHGHLTPLRKSISVEETWFPSSPLSRKQCHFRDFATKKVTEILWKLDGIMSSWQLCQMIENYLSYISKLVFCSIKSIHRQHSRILMNEWA